METEFRAESSVLRQVSIVQELNLRFLVYNIFAKKNQGYSTLRDQAELI